MPLDTLTNVKTRLGIAGTADDTLLALLQGSADRWLANHCQLDFAGGTYTEYHPGGTAFVHVRNYPITSVTSVKVDANYEFGPNTVVNPAAYVVHGDRGVIQALHGPFCCSELEPSECGPWPKLPRAVQVIYSTAANEVPEDVREAYALLIGFWYRLVKTQVATTFQNLTQQQTTGVFASYAQAAAVNGPPREVFWLLAPYRVPSL